MQRILYMDVSVLEDAALYEAWLPFLSVERQKKVAALKNPAAARLSCGSCLHSVQIQAQPQS